MIARGFTLIEVVVALVILMTGVAAAVNATGAATRLTARSARAGRVARLAEQHLEMLPLGGCVAGTGRYTEDVIDVVWSIVPSGKIGEVTIFVHWPSRAGMRVDTFVTAFLCP